MYNLRIINKEQFFKIFNMRNAIDDVELAYRLYSRKEADVFPVIAHRFEAGIREMDIKAGYLAGAGIFGMKMLGFCSENPIKGLPALAGLIVIMDIERQQPIGILDGTSVTFLRTGAAGAVAAKIFARKDASGVLIVGAGNQGKAQLSGLICAMPQIKEVKIADILEKQSKKFIEEQKKIYPHLNMTHCPYTKLAEAIASADIIVTCTRSNKFFIKREWVRPGTHINAIGADMPGKQEIQPDIVASVKLFGDSRSQVTRKGECQYAFSSGLITEADITEIGEVLEGLRLGRTSDGDITLFDATGMAIQDLIVSASVLKNAAMHNIGTIISF